MHACMYVCICTFMRHMHLYGYRAQGGWEAAGREVETRPCQKELAFLIPEFLILHCLVLAAFHASASDDKKAAQKQRTAEH